MSKISLILALSLLASCGSSDKSSSGSSPSRADVPSDKSSRVERGRTYDSIKSDLENGKFEEARKSIHVGLRAEPKNGRLWLYGGIYFMKRGNVDLAKLYFDRAFEFGERGPGLFANRAVWYLNKKRTWEAINELQIAIRQDKNHVNANYMMAELLMTNSNFRGAIKYLKALQNADVDTPDIRKMLAACYVSEKRFDEAQKLLSPFRGKPMGFANVFNLMFAMKSLGNVEGAKSVYQEASDNESFAGDERNRLKRLLGV